MLSFATKAQRAPPAILASAVEDFLREEGRGEARIRGPLFRSAGAEIFRVDCPGKEALALKVCIDPVTGKLSPEPARRAFESLQRLHALTLKAVPLACARPVGLIEEFGIVLMEWVPGRSLPSFLQGASNGSAIRVGRQAGAWLAALQLSSGISRTAPTLEPMLRQITAPRSGTVGRAAELLHRTAAATFAERVAWSCCYGDFKPSNLMVNGRRLIGSIRS